ncbi:MAG: hypothetical protein H6729_10120 [Deltaproteobacteria bacterium]|nr:hypothetical protein [Deltaproteobacteria bacterium]
MSRALGLAPSLVIVITQALVLASTMMMMMMIQSCAIDGGPLDGSASGDSGSRDGEATDAERSDADSNGNADAGAVDADATVAPIADECDPVSQDCTAPLKCVAEPRTGHPGAECITWIDPEKPHGSDCDVRGECEPGLACVRTSTASAQCELLCHPNGNGAECDVLTENAQDPEYDCLGLLFETNWGSCVRLAPQCDPYNPDVCSASQACQPFVQKDGTLTTRCRTAGPGVAGETCGAGAPNCAAGFACVDQGAGSAAACVQYCEVNLDCPNPQQCKGSVSGLAFAFCID